MRELVLEGRECNVCGARVRGEYERVSSNVEARGVSFVESFEDEGLTRAPRERSGLAHAAGFAGVLSLFRYSCVPLALSHWGPEATLGTCLFIALGLCAPISLVLAFAAGASLDRSREKAGALPALFGFFVGLVLMLDLLFWLAPPWLKYLKVF